METAGSELSSHLIAIPSAFCRVIYCMRMRRMIWGKRGRALFFTHPIVIAVLGDTAHTVSQTAQLVLALSQYKCNILQAEPPANGGYVLCLVSAPERQSKAPLLKIPSRGALRCRTLPKALLLREQKPALLGKRMARLCQETKKEVMRV